MKKIYYRDKYNYEMNAAISYAVEEKEKELQNIQKELQSIKDALSILIKTLQETGKSIEEISLITNLDISDIKNILNEKS